VVELRFFGGLSVKETAEILKMSPETVQRDWKFASGPALVIPAGTGASDPGWPGRVKAELRRRMHEPVTLVGYT
jgi:DeoR/GlpR family transcriptional regulator of sugar metabolism